MVSRAMRKGQISLEFLSTYAWAIIVVGIMIGVLVYINVFKPEDVIGSACQVSNEVLCEDYVINMSVTTDFPAVSVLVKNNLRDGIVTDYMECTFDNRSYKVRNPTVSDIPIGQERVLSCVSDRPSSFVIGQKVTVPFLIKYKINGSNLGAVHTIEGKVISQIRSSP